VWVAQAVLDRKRATAVANMRVERLQQDEEWGLSATRECMGCEAKEKAWGSVWLRCRYGLLYAKELDSGVLFGSWYVAENDMGMANSWKDWSASLDDNHTVSKSRSVVPCSDSDPNCSAALFNADMSRAHDVTPIVTFAQIHIF
jgi:hypothetical protein